MTTVDRAKVLELYRVYGPDAPAHFPPEWGEFPTLLRKHGDGSHEEADHGNWAKGGGALGSVTISPSERLVERATHLLGEKVHRFASMNGWEVDAVMDQLDKNTQEWLEDKRPCIRVPSLVLGDIIEEGVQNQFQTGTSRGTYMPDLRARGEYELFGLEDDTPADQRPIYGYVGDLMGNDGEVLQYGDARLILHASVQERTSITPSDSLSIGDLDYGTAGGVPEMWEEAGWRQSAPFLEQTSIMSGTPARADRYVEAQIHGGVTIDDVEEVIFDYGYNGTESIPKALTDRLDALGIIWSVAS